MREMKLMAGKTTDFEMTVAGYQFPHLANQEYDADWLIVSVQVRHPRGAWNKTDPCLLTWELAELTEWFERIADNNPHHSNIDFMEPELSFEWLGEQRNTLRVHLNYSLRPSWSSYHGPNEEKDFFVEFAVSADDLRTVVTSLRAEIARFPVRVKV